MTGQQGHKLEIELVEGAEELELGGTATREPRRGAWRRVARAWPLALVALLALAFFVQEQSSRAALAERRATLAGQWGYVAELGPGLRPVWTSEGIADLYTATVVGTTTLVRGGSSVSDTGHVAVDLRSGAQRWSVLEEEYTREFCTAVPSESTAAFECRVYRYGRVGVTGFGESAEVIELRDAETGEVVASREAGELVDVAAWDEELAVLDAGDGVELRRETYDGQVRWTVPVLDRAPADEELARVSVERDLALVTSAARVLAVGPTGAVVFDRALPAPVTGVTPPGSTPTLTALASGFAVTVAAPDGPLLQVFDARGRLEIETGGRLHPVAADDGSVSGVLVVASGARLEVWDRETGRIELVADGGASGEVLLLDGALIVVQGGELVARDLKSGTVRWAIELPRGRIVGTDGSLVLALDPRGADRTLLAVGIGSGREEWRVPVEPAGAWPQVIGGTLLLHADSTLVRWS